MPDYKALYLKLFSAQAKVIELLQEANSEAEDIIMDGDKEPLVFPEATEA